MFHGGGSGGYGGASSDYQQQSQQQQQQHGQQLQAPVYVPSSRPTIPSAATAAAAAAAAAQYHSFPGSGSPAWEKTAASWQHGVETYAAHHALAGHASGSASAAAAAAAAAAMGPHSGHAHPHATHPHTGHPHSSLAAAAAAPFYAQNVAMMSSWRAYDGAGFQRASPYEIAETATGNRLATRATDTAVEALVRHLDERTEPRTPRLARIMLILPVLTACCPRDLAGELFAPIIGDADLERVIESVD